MFEEREREGGGERRKRTERKKEIEKRKRRKKERRKKEKKKIQGTKEGIARKIPECEKKKSLKPIEVNGMKEKN